MAAGTAVGSGHQPFTGASLSDEVYQAIADILQEQLQFQLEGYKVRAIKRRMAARMRAAGLPDPEAYLQVLADNAAEQQQLLQALSIHVSTFLRNPSAFRALRRKIVPALLAARRAQGGKLRFWSVGCAHGEEAYSLALICRKLQMVGDQVAIIGTDISSAAIRKARRGGYAEQQLRNLSAEQRSKYFTPCGHEYRVADELRDGVQFFRHDILAERPFYRADLILCRNLLIYFSREQQYKVVTTLAGALAPGGYLMLGRAETMAPACRELFQCVDPAERIYQRLAG